MQTVLLVEDEPQLVGLLRDFLADEGFGVISAPDASGRSRRSTTACCST